MEFEQFIERLALTQSKWEEDEVYSAEWHDPRILCFIAHMRPDCGHVPTVNTILSMLDSEPEWSIPLVELDLQEKSVELLNTAEKMARSHGGSKRKMVGLALLQLFNGQDGGGVGVGEVRTIHDLVSSDDATLHYLALRRLGDGGDSGDGEDSGDVQGLSEFEGFVESCLNGSGGGGEEVFRAALRVLKRTENEENRDIVQWYEDRGPAAADPRPLLAIKSVGQEPFVGDWLEPVEHATVIEDKNEKRTIFAGTNLLLGDEERLMNK